MDEDKWRVELDKLRARKWHRGERLGEIVAQQTDILSFLGLAVPIGPLTHPWLGVLCDAVLEVAFRLCTEIKYLFSTPRPVDLAPDIAPVIQTPAHSSFPAGHGAEAFALATVLGAFFNGQGTNPPTPLERGPGLRRLAARIADNRAYAGVHFPIDMLAGAVLGDAIGRLVLDKLDTTQVMADPVQHVTFTAADELSRTVTDYGSDQSKFPAKHDPIGRPPTADVLKWLVDEVAAELGR